MFNAEGPGPIAFAEIESVISTLAWVFGDAMVKQLDGLIAEEANDSAALSSADRQRQAAQIQGDLLAVERDLAWFVWAGLSQGLPVWFTVDANPAVILGAQLVTRRTLNGGGSSPEHGAINIIEGRR